MKKTTCFWIAGSAIMAGVAAYGIYKLLQKKNSEKSADVVDNSSDCIITPDDYDSAEITSEQTILSDFEQIQQQAASSIRRNHVDGAQRLKKVVDEVANNSDEFKKTNAQVSSDLDELLK